jgi:hypothetical protein
MPNDDYEPVNRLVVKIWWEHIRQLQNVVARDLRGKPAHCAVRFPYILTITK